MRSWKEKTFSRIALGVIFTGTLIIYATPRAVFAQEPVAAAVEEQEEYDFLIDEALNEIESNFDLIVPDEGLIDEPVAVEPDILGEVIEIEDIELSTAVLEDVEISEEAVKEILFETKIIPLLYAEASSLLEALREIKSEDGEVLYDEDEHTFILTDTFTPLLAMEALIKETDVLLETGVFTPEYVHAVDIIASIKEILTKNIGQARMGDESESIVVTDTPLKIAQVKDLIMALDHFNRDVLIEAKVLQITLNDEHLDGVDWEAIVSEYQEIVFPGFESQTEGRLRLGTISQEDHAILVEALDTVGAIRVVSEEKTATDSGIKKTVDIFVSSLKAVVEQDGPELSVVGQEGEKVQFSVTPTMKRDGPLSIFVEPHLLKSAVEKGEGPEGVMVEVAENDTIVIGSLFKDVIVPSERKVPLLGSLPLLGFVFRKEGKDVRRTEVIIFLTIKTREKKE